MSDYQAQVEAFLARGGKITRAAEGEGLNLSAKDWYNKVSDGPAVVTVIEETVCEDGNLLAEDAYRAAKMSGASDEAAWESYDAENAAGKRRMISGAKAYRNLFGS